MSKSTIAAVAVIMSAKDFKEKSFAAYMAYVAFIQGNATVDETVSAIAPVMSPYGFTLTPENLANTLTLRMTSYGSDHGEKARKIKSIGIFRSFIKEGWKEVKAAPVHFNAGKAPVKKLSKAEMKSELEKLIAEREALMQQLNAALPDDSAAE